MENGLLKLTRLEMSNFRCFRRMEKPLEFESDLTVVVAKNGCGKTAVLDAIRISLGTFTKGLNRLSQAGIRRQDASLTALRAEHGKGADYPVAIRAEGMVDFKPCTWERLREKEDGRTTTKGARVISDFGDRLHHAVVSDDREVPELPILSFYGTGRLWKADVEYVKKNTGNKPAPAFENCFAGYEDALTANSIFDQVKRWMIGADLCKNSAVEQETELGRSTAAQYEAVATAVDRALDGTGFRTPHYSTRYGEMTLVEDRQGNAGTIAVPVSWTSDGIKAAFALVADIAYRCARLNPSFGVEVCSRTQGIVMIDEVDLFLHPRWQQHILSDLQRIFPRIQFVVTTHSPQVVSSVPQRCLRIIDDDGQIKPAPIWTEGVESSRILEGIFGTKPYPEGSACRQKMNQYIKDVYAGKWDDPQVRRIGDELSANLAGLDADFDTARLHVENEEWERDHASN